ncbi:conjugal transfer protein TrbL family protein (plasmid) [Oscillospiraceae bacterium MB08-C2-2]|nr:conjugal transfer protein TrbL family protein [Oscillospiraceae bacterium MB08-C2-2]
MEWLFDLWADLTQNLLQKLVMGYAEFLLGLSLNASTDFWNNPIINLLIEFSGWMNMIVMVVSLLFLLFDIMEESTGRGVEWGMVFLNLVKAMVFVFTNRWVAVLAMQLGELIASSISFRGDVTGITTNLEKLNQLAGSASNMILMILVVCIVAVIFLFVALRRFGAMLLQIFTSSFYITDIIRGDTSKLGEWIRQTLAIACTYVFQYMFFYLGLIFVSNGEPMLGIACWISITQVDKVLQKFGFSTGAQGMLGTVGRMAAEQGFSRLVKL